MNVILTKEEEQKRDDLIRLIIHAAEVVEFHIKRLKCHTEYKDTLDDLNMGLNNLYAGIKNFRVISQIRFLKKLEDRWDISQENVVRIMESAKQKIREAEQLGKSVSIKSLLRSELEEKLDIENISNGIS